MKIQDESYYYTQIAIYVKSCIPNEDVDKWEYAVFNKYYSHGAAPGDGFYYIGEIEKSLQFLPISQLGILEGLSIFTKANNYAPWNKIVFKLYPNNKFEIEYIWDQAHHDQEERWAQGNYDDLEDDLE
jgi:hypothetical protein